MTRTLTVRSIVLAAASAALATSTFAADTPGPRETGLWYDDTGKGAVKIEACGAKLCGKIYWLKDPLNAEGRPLFDRHNPNESERKRPICGLQIMGGLAAMDDGSWDSGWIYDPKEGKSYSVALAMTAPDTLKVTGYLVMKMMGRTLTWKKAPVDLPACTQSAAAPAPAPAAAAATAPAAKAAQKKAPAAAATTNAKAGEDLPWTNKKAPAGAAASTGASKLGGAKPATVKKPAATPPAAKAITQQPLVETEAR